MNPKYKNLILFIPIFGLASFAGLKFSVFGAFLAGLYLSNGIVHSCYGIFGFGKITPKKLFGEERLIHLIWGIYNFILSAILVYYSNLEANWLPFIGATLIALLLLPIMARKGK